MIDDFDDFCLYMYYIVDELWRGMAGQFRRPGPEPECSDSELMTMILVGECRGWDVETELLSHFQEHGDLFPQQPSQSRFNRRRRALTDAVNLIRQAALCLLDIAQDQQCTIDSLPIEVVQFHLVPGSTGDWAAHGASFGKVPSKKQTIFGYKLHLLVTLGGVILDFDLAPAHAFDLPVGEELLEGHSHLEVLGDKAYLSAASAARLWLERGIRLITLPRRNQTRQLPKPIRRLFNAVRQIIETVNGQLAEQFHIETNHAHTFEGLCARLHSKLAAHTLCIYLNRLLGKVDFLQIKSLAFPI